MLLQLSKIFVFGFFLITLCESQEDWSKIPSFLRFTPSQRNYIRDVLLNLIGRTASSPRSLSRAAQIGKIQPTQNNLFPCKTTGFRSAQRPKSVHQLRPGDIDVIGALGDSLTAGNGAAAQNVLHVYTENRGISWSIGGQGSWKEFLTLPNILKEFNPKLVGYSLKDSLSHHRASQFNAAEIGAMSRDIPFMATQLVKRIKHDTRVNFKEDWKLITLMIGSNDFCLDVCYTNNVLEGSVLHKRNLNETIEFLKKNLPRTLLQIVISPNLKVLMNLKGLPPFCRLTQTVECPCLIGLPLKHKRKDVLKVMEEWQKVEIEVAMNPKYTTDEFAVVYQPFTLNLTFPIKRDTNGKVINDLSYLSQDCFHFSQKGYSRASNALWNNMLEPVGRKTTDWEKEFKIFKCPTEENPYIFTNKNSL